MVNLSAIGLLASEDAPLPGSCAVEPSVSPAPTRPTSWRPARNPGAFATGWGNAAPRRGRAEQARARRRQHCASPFGLGSAVTA
jgi:hypothetical protein